MNASVPGEVVTDDDGLDEKTWRQLRQCTRIALYYLRGQVRDGYAPAKAILDVMESVLTEGPTDR